MSKLELCQKDVSTCASVDIDDPQASDSYFHGCASKDGYSCFRLGQFFEVKRSDLQTAVKYYGESCAHNYADGCDEEKELRSRLCFLVREKKFCGGEPEGEWRIYAYLENFDPKYRDAFIKHDFSIGITKEPVKALYQKRMDEKNRKLLEALELARKNGNHDGDGGETLTHDIRMLKGQKPQKD